MTHETSTHAKQVKELFDAKAADWPVKYGANGPLTSRLQRFATTVVAYVPAGGLVLDLGCGTGELARHLSAVGFQATGCDISQTMLHKAAAVDSGRPVEWVPLRPGWHLLPFGPATFDAVVVSSVLEYADEPIAVLTECARVLRQGGSVLCTVPEATHPIRWLEWAASNLARLTVIRATGRHWPRLDHYLTYLLISRQRHLGGWWRAAATHAGLRIEATKMLEGRLSSLRLLVLQNPPAT